jgi:hypothetical protein
MIGVRPLDANAGFIAGDDARRAQNRLGLVRFDLEPRMRADKHVHQRALAHGEPERIPKHAAQPLVGERLETLVVDRQRMNARPERRRRRHRRRWSFGLQAAVRASARVAAMAHNVGLYRRYLDLVVFADQLARIVA